MILENPKKAYLGEKLIDIHSQHQTLKVTSNDFQFQVLDALAGADREIESYKRGLKLLKQKEKDLQYENWCAKDQTKPG